LLLLTVYCASGQTATQPGNEVIRALCSEVDPAGWLYFREDPPLSADKFWEVYGEAMGLSPLDEMRPQPTFEHDELGYTKTLFQQYYQTLEVEGAQYTLHSQGSRLVIAHGKIVEGLRLEPKARILEAEALQRALSDIGAEEYAWESEDWEKDIQAESGDSLASWYPRGRLLIAFVQGDKLIQENYRLCWRFEIRALSPASSLAVYVDAHAGEVLKRQSLLHVEWHPLGLGTGPGNRTLTLTPGLNPSSVGNLGVSVSLNGQTASDTHTFALIDCGEPCTQCPYRLAAPAPLDVRIYPQPAADNIHIEVPPGYLPATIEIYDLAGKRVLKQITIQTIDIISLRLPTGYYWLRVQNGYESSSHPVQIIQPYLYTNETHHPYIRSFFLIVSGLPLGSGSGPAPSRGCPALSSAVD
jgi:hypothetical protein